MWASRSPWATRSHGRIVSPRTSAAGCAQSRTRSTPVATARPPKRSALASSHRPDTADPEARPAASPASRQKLPTARAPPASTPSPTRAPPSIAATSASTTTITPLSAATRTRSSLTLIQIPLRVLRGSKQAHESRRDPQSKTDEGEPGPRAEPPVSVVPADEPDHRREHHRHSDRGELSDGLPGRFARRHVKTNTSTSAKSRQGKAQCLSEHSAHARTGDAIDHEQRHRRDHEEDDPQRRRFARAASDVEGKDADRDRFPAAQREKEHRRRLLERRHE